MLITPLSHVSLALTRVVRGGLGARVAVGLPDGGGGLGERDVGEGHPQHRHWPRCLREETRGR